MFGWTQTASYAGGALTGVLVPLPIAWSVLFIVLGLGCGLIWLLDHRRVVPARRYATRRRDRVRFAEASGLPRNH